jgi:hypothetical protein
MTTMITFILLSFVSIGHVNTITAGKDDFNLSNAFMSLEFYPPQEGGGARSIKNSDGFEFINRHQDKSLWQVEMKRIPQNEAKRDSIFRWNLDPEICDGVAKRSDSRTTSDMILIKSDAARAVCKTEKGKDTLTMTWQGIDVGAEKAVLDVSVIVTLSEGDRFARFTAAFNNRSEKFTVFYLTAPLFNNIYPPDGRTDLDWLASPVYEGRLMRDPIRNGIMGKPYYFQPNRGGHSMQFDTYYHNNNGLYLGCFDGMQNVKRYYLAADPSNGLSWGMVYVPDNMKSVPQVWRAPYDTVLCCYKGDWYDACRIYREWALKQSWAAEGTLDKRTSTPDWFKEIDLWMMSDVATQPPTIPYNSKITTALEGLTKGIQLFRWGKGNLNSSKMAPDDRFPLTDRDLLTFKLARDNNYALMARIQGIGWDRETKSFRDLNGVDHTVRNFYGERFVWELGEQTDPGSRHIIAIAHPGDVWANALGGAILKMAREGFDAVYLDSFNHAGTYMNFNPLYGSESGGGNAYIKGNREMLRKIKDKAREIRPRFCFTAESFWEGNIAELDGFWTCNTTAQLLKKAEVFAIPMVQAVYHDYTISFGAWMSQRDLQEDNNGLSYIAKSAQAFVWGVKAGFVQPLLLTGYKDNQIALDTVRKRCRAYAASRKFLVYGEMLREPKLLHAVPEMDLKWYVRWSKTFYEISMPAVLCSLWRAPDGNLGLVAYNISPKEQQVSFVLDDPHYRIEKGTSVSITCLYPFQGNTSERKSLNEPSLVVSCNVPPRTPLVLEIELKH